jgi:4,5-DOPA dioxygenase extradiol
MNADDVDFEASDTQMPVLFVGHGSPMNAIEDNEFSQAWEAVGRSLPAPRAILCISAHWETLCTAVTAAERPETIHDFYGFPAPLYQVSYPSPGSAGLARLTQQTVSCAGVELDADRGLDHGTWSVLCRMFPDADLPVVQLSLDSRMEPGLHYQLAKELRGLRNRGVLIVGSGNMVHNLGLLAWENMAFDWALEFDERLRRLILAGDHEAIIHYEKMGRAAALSIPTNDHYLPLLYSLALQDKDEEVSFFAEKVTLGSISMRSLRIG